MPNRWNGDEGPDVRELLEPTREMLMIGAMVIHPEIIESANGLMQPEDFVGQDAEIYKALLRLWGDGKTIDSTHTVMDELADAGVYLEDPDYLHRACLYYDDRGVDFYVNFERHCSRVALAGLERRLRLANLKAAMLLKAQDEDPQELQDQAREIFDQVERPPAPEDEEDYVLGNPDRKPDFEPETPIIPERLYSGVSLWYGPPKCYKTTFGLGAAHAVATGAYFLGQQARQLRVGWLEEMPVRLMWEYSESVRLGMGYGPSEFFVWRGGPLDLMKAADQQRVQSWVRRREIELLFVDTLRGFSSVRENESDDVQVLARAFFHDRLSKQQGVSVVLIHHAPKGGETARGSGDFMAAADSLCRFWKAEENSDTVTVKLDGRHSPARFRFEVASTPGAMAIREPDSSPPPIPRDLLLTARDIVVDSGPDGVTQNKLLERLRDSGQQFRRERIGELVELLLGRYPGIRLEYGPNRSKLLKAIDLTSDQAG